jgi:hypothetical protein
MTARAKPAEQFHFADVQWRPIRYAVIDGCDFPSAFDEVSLQSGADEYLQKMRAYASPSVRKMKMKRLSKQLAQARDTLMTIARCDYEQLAYYEASFSRDCGWFFDQEDLDAGRPVINVMELLDEWTLRFADADGWYCTHPRDMYFYNALELWEEAGGHFRFSRAKPGSQHQGRPGGPTIRYLEAVSRPLMAKGHSLGRDVCKNH